MESAHGNDRSAQNAALASEIAKLVAEFTGRRATNVRAFINHDVVVCLHEDGTTAAEQNLIAAGQAELVTQQRDALRRAMEKQLIAIVRQHTGRAVRMVLSGMLGESCVEVFELEPDRTPAQAHTTD